MPPAIRSMTGFGRGRSDVAGRRVVVEVRTVNHRFLEVKQRLPWPDPTVEQQLVQAIKKRLERGAVTVAVRDEGGSDEGPAVHADLPLARAYARALEDVRAACQLAEPVSLALIAAQPGVLQAGLGSLDGEALWAALSPGVDEALDSLLHSRAREGEALQKTLQGHLGLVRRLTGEISLLARDAPEETRRRLTERLARLSLPVEIDSARLLQEVALLADKADVAEELARLETHLDELQRLLDTEGPVGRRLDFLAQELHREINTIGAKTQRVEITQRVITAKVEIERIREQVQNVE